MRKWLVLTGAILLEVTATLSLRAALDDPWWAILAVLGYIGAFIALSLLLAWGCRSGWSTASGPLRASP